jgi:hypothetical protein
MSSDKDNDPFSSYLDLGLCSNPRQFIKTFFQLAKVAVNPWHALCEQHEVRDVGVNKAKAKPQHESFTASILDNNTRQNHMFIIEHTAVRGIPCTCEFQF